MNRIWYTLFGEGLVRSLEDFGVQGEWPTHPELLDRLACDFVASGYDVKALVRRIVGSATFRQSSRRRPELEESDPENRLLGRAPSYRHDGEILRDLALSISGLLDEEVGGESVKPYQPAGLWEEQTFRNKARLKDDFYQQDQGRALWRRGLYVFRKRSIPPPNLATLDSPTREVCIVRRSRTNTPLQALVLMNDPVFVEAARVLAQRTLREGGSSTEEHLEFMFELATSRLPDATEKAILQGALEKQLRRFRNDSDAATRLLAIGEAPRDETLEPVTLAAWTLVASLIFNLDETLTQR